MTERVRGIVKNVIEGDVFELNVTGVGPFNEQEYQASEKVRIAGINDPELYPGNAGPQKLERLKDREVQCFIMTRDGDGNVVAVVQCLGQGKG